MVISIVPATLRDMCFIGAHMREEDRREALATVNVASGRDAAILCFAASCEAWRWVALYNNQPVCAFGVSAPLDVQPQVRHAWAFGTKGMWRCIPQVTRFIQKHWPKGLLAEGANRLEAYSIDGHDNAHRWLEALGAKLESEQLERGVNGETFRLYVWKRSDSDVLLNTKIYNANAKHAKQER